MVIVKLQALNNALLTLQKFKDAEREEEARASRFLTSQQPAARQLSVCGALPSQGRGSTALADGEGRP